MSRFVNRCFTVLMKWKVRVETASLQMPLKSINAGTADRGLRKKSDSMHIRLLMLFRMEHAVVVVRQSQIPP